MVSSCHYFLVDSIRFSRHGFILLLVMTVLIMNFSALLAQTPLPAIRKSFTTLEIGSGRMPYWRNRPIDAYDSRVARAIIVIHGSGGNAEGYFDRINNIIPSEWGDRVMVIAPHFQEESEANNGEYWWDGDWREGGASGGISSYAVVDHLVRLLRNGNFPNLKWIVIGGHSAGGQFSQRYAAFTDIDLQPAPNSAFVKFVPANPSSYVYLNEFRYNGNNNWTVPQDCSSGDGYNDWKYGLESLYGYTAARGADWARTHLPNCWVELLGGEEDVLADDGLDTDCGAMRQGENRYERAEFFNAFMDRFYPANNFSLTPVPGVGHDSAEMFASPQGKNAFFFPDDNTTSIDETRENGAFGFILRQNYPNPFNPTTKIRFRLTKAAPVKLVILNAMGQTVRTLLQGEMAAGEREIEWDARDHTGALVASGTYICRIQSGGEVQSKGLMFLK